MFHSLFVRLISVLAICFSAGALGHGWPDFNQLITESSPAVVRIDTYTGQMAMGVSPSPGTYQDFFEHGPNRDGNVPGTGSGFLISENGYVLTNQHVVQDVAYITVKLIDHRVYDAKVVGVDARSDLALLKIDETDLPVLEFADPETIKVGQWVIAIGAPFGLDYTASAGIISAIGRSIPTAGGDSYVPFIQSDVAINPGSSGGPLLNLEGRVVGVNSQIFSRPGGGSIGLSFAIPSKVATSVIHQLRTTGRVARGWLGVYVQSVDASLMKSSGRNQNLGAFIAQVQPGSPAADAGIMAGDIVLKLNGEAIFQPGDLPQVTGMLSPGDKVIVDILRDAKSLSLVVNIGELPEPTPLNEIE